MTALPVLLLLMPMGCGKLFSINITESSSTRVERGTLVEDLVGQLGFSGFTAMDISDNAELQNQGVEPGDIKDVELTQIQLTASDPDGADLSFLDEIEVYVSSPDLPEERIASAIDFPEGEAVVELELDEVDLTDYAVSQSMTITTDVRGGRPPQDTTVDALIRLRVGVTGKGIF